ncbi:unnamed protein product [Rotaria sp. Silwood2]|nr:unnamed protein product [Rotaria sp. Silwood2]
MLIQTYDPAHLVCFNLTDYGYGGKQNIVCLLNNIWCLPKLKHCDLDFIHAPDRSFIGPTIISLSIEYLSIKNMEIYPRDVYNLFEHTPRLQHFHANLSFHLYFEPLPNIDTSMTTLSFFWRHGIVNKLSNIKIFRLRMSFTIGDNNRMESKIDELIDKFRTSFWLDKHDWFVRCE